jgi:hypothetical protein
MFCQIITSEIRYKAGLEPKPRSIEQRIEHISGYRLPIALRRLLEELDKAFTDSYEIELFVHANAKLRIIV